MARLRPSSDARSSKLDPVTHARLGRRWRNIRWKRNNRRFLGAYFMAYNDLPYISAVLQYIWVTHVKHGRATGARKREFYLFCRRQEHLSGAPLLDSNEDAHGEALLRNHGSTDPHNNITLATIAILRTTLAWQLVQTRLQALASTAQQIGELVR